MFQAARDYLPLPVIDEIYKVLVKKSKSTPGAISEKPLLFLNFHLNVAPSSQYRATVSTTIVPATASSSGKTVGRWLKDKREKKQEEIRAQNAQLHSAVSAAGVAPAVTVIAAAFASTSIKGQEMAQSHMALASPATLVAALCVEVAESMGAERNHLTFVVISAINVRSADNIMTLIAACHRCGILLLVLSSMYTFEGHEAAIYFVFPHRKENIQIRKWTFA